MSPLLHLPALIFSATLFPAVFFGPRVVEAAVLFRAEHSQSLSLGALTGSESLLAAAHSSMKLPGSAENGTNLRLST